MKLLNKNKERGFTLIELMIVIAIVAVLSGIILSNMSDARKKGKDAQILTDLAQAKLALSNYYSVHGSYPNVSTAKESGSLVGGTECSDINNPNWMPGMTPRYIPALPQSPLYTGPSGCADDAGYGYGSDGTGYRFLLVSRACDDVSARDASMSFSSSTPSAPGRCGSWTNGWGPSGLTSQQQTQQQTQTQQQQQGQH